MEPKEQKENVLPSKSKLILIIIIVDKTGTPQNLHSKTNYFTSGIAESTLHKQLFIFSKCWCGASVKPIYLIVLYYNT